MNLKDIKENLSKDIEKLGYHLYSLDYKKKDNIIEILIDESLDLNEISKLSEKISKIMDKYDDELDEYILDVASVGSERIIKKEDISNALKQYIHIKTKDIELDGTLLKYKDDILTIEYLDKTRKKQLTVNINDVKKLRYAIKF